jgi:hypothetical protein
MKKIRTSKKLDLTAEKISAIGSLMLEQDGHALQIDQIHLSAVDEPTFRIVCQWETVNGVRRKVCRRV